MPIEENYLCEPFRAWNRLEPRPRETDFNRALRSEVHDGLWFLTRQWQFGELEGEDTGSAIFAKVKLESTKITKYQNGTNQAEGYSDAIPLEARVEREPVVYDFQTRARAASQWMKILKKHGNAFNATSPATPFSASNYKELFMTNYGFEMPSIDLENDALDVTLEKMRVKSMKKATQVLDALQERSFDGVACLEALLSGGRNPLVIPAGWENAGDASHLPFVQAAAAQFVAWFEALYSLPASEADRTWIDEKLEYQFACALPNVADDDSTILRAEEYYHGQLDWYAFDIDSQADTHHGLSAVTAEEKDAVTKTEVLTVMPTPVEFAGMPNHRWWAFEDGSVDLTNIKSESTDIAKVLLTEFALMYSNDWFVVPYTVDAGTLTEVKGIVVTDVFGEKTYINPATQGHSQEWSGWGMFNLTMNDAPEDSDPDIRLFIPPVVSKIQESEPVEAVAFVRDEMANMVWGIETRVPDLLGQGTDGHAAANNYLNALNKMAKDAGYVTTEPLLGNSTNAPLKYELGNTVPENWIPFQPVHKPGSNRAIQLQRASLPRFLMDGFQPVRAQTEIARPGMKNDPAEMVSPFVNPSRNEQQEPYFIHEEEIPRSGIVVKATHQRVRWYDGSIVNWYGRRKETGRGEGSSGLRFDTVITSAVNSEEPLEPAENERN